MKIGIIGGGIMGISLGYYLSQENYEVEIFEASPVLGGLAGPITLSDGTMVDRFYHAILSSDRHLRQLCEELEISDQLRFRETKMGFYYKGAIHPMNNIVDFMKFPPLGWIDRFRLGLTVLVAQFYKDWMKLESVNVEKWLIRLGGRRTFQNIWRPMLMAKFDGGFENTPATYIWSRLVRMKSTRGGASQKEEAPRTQNKTTSQPPSTSQPAPSLGSQNNKANGEGHLPGSHHPYIVGDWEEAEDRYNDDHLFDQIDSHYDKGTGL